MKQANAVSGTAKPESIQFPGFAAEDQPFVTRYHELDGELRQVQKRDVALQVELGHLLVDRKAVCDNDPNLYSVIRKTAGKTEAENLSRFDSEIEALELSRATAWRYIRKYRQHLKATNPVPVAVIQMATSNGVLDPTTKIAQETLADAFLAAGQPSNPTPQQCMAILADACERVEQAPSDALGKFQTLLSKAVQFAKENNLDAEVIHGSLESAIAVYFGMPGARVTREKASIYQQEGNS